MFNFQIQTDNPSAGYNINTTFKHQSNYKSKGKCKGKGKFKTEVVGSLGF